MHQLDTEGRRYVLYFEDIYNHGFFTDEYSIDYGDLYSAYGEQSSWDSVKEATEAGNRLFGPDGFITVKVWCVYDNEEMQEVVNGV